MWPWFEFLLPFLGGSFLLVSLCLERGSSDREVEASDFDIEMDPQLQHTVETHPVVAFVRFCGVFFGGLLESRIKQGFCMVLLKIVGLVYEMQDKHECFCDAFEECCGCAKHTLCANCGSVLI